MTETFLSGRVTLRCGDNRAVLDGIADCSIDSIVTDPPYALVSIVKRFGKPGSAPAKGNEAYQRASAGFMGKQWDTGEVAFDLTFWAECLRVLKPGGHVVAFSGTRTYHRMACAIEDAGFEVRDMLSWNFGSGFPKSHNISKTLDDKKERCTCPAHLRDLQHGLDSSQPLSGGAQQDVRPDLLGGEHWHKERGAEGHSVDSVRNVRQANSSRAVEGAKDAEIILQQFLPEQDIRNEAETLCGEREGQAATRQGISRRKKSGLEGRRDPSKTPRQLRERSLCALPAGINLNGAGGRLCDGASPGDGSMDRETADSHRVRSSSGPQAAKQSAIELRALAGQPQPQIGGAWDYCGRCGKPLVPEGLGTALKPAHEPICLARKPLIGTVAANVLEHGTGAINIDGCRVGIIGDRRDPCGADGIVHRTTGNTYGEHKENVGFDLTQGRWPANIIHDGSDEVIAAFPDLHGAGSAQGKQDKWADQENKEGWGNIGLGPNGARFGDSGSAARFFYTAKADADDRLGSKHPTVKPVDLMQWLVRLVTPKDGTVLDPFAGTGTTAEAAFREGMNCILIEREEEYQADIRRRMALCMAGPDERKRESIKAKLGDLPFEEGSLFA